MLSNPINSQKHFKRIRTNKNIIKRNKIFIEHRNHFQLSSLHSIPSTNISHMPYKCIYILINEDFMVRSRIQAYKGDANVYGPLWTPTCICAVWTFFLIISYLFFPYFFQKDFIIPYIIDNRMTDSPHHHSIMYYFTPLYSPLVYKDNFPLFYMYKLTRYYFVFHIDLGPMFPRSNIL